MVAVTDLKPYRPNTFSYEGELFQFGGIAYKVLKDGKNPPKFDKNSSRFTVVFGEGGSGGGDGVGIQTVAVNEDGDLIVTLTNGDQQNAGHVAGSSPAYNLQSERLVATAGVLSPVTYSIDTTKPVKLIINHAVYSSAENPSAISVDTDPTYILWDAETGGFALTTQDVIVAEYFRA